MAMAVVAVVAGARQPEAADPIRVDALASKTVADL